MPVEHTEWVGDRYGDDGLDGQRVALVLFSHWGDVGDDHAEFTNDVIRGLMKGERERALDMIQSYFADSEPASFWPKVVFFNLSRIWSVTLLGVMGGEQRTSTSAAWPAASAS